MIFHLWIPGTSVFLLTLVWSWQVLEKLLGERRRISRASVSSASVDPVDTWKRQSFVRSSQESHMSRADLRSHSDLGRERTSTWMLNGIPGYRDTRDVGFWLVWTLIWTMSGSFENYRYSTWDGWIHCPFNSVWFPFISFGQHQKTVNTDPPWLILLGIPSKSRALTQGYCEIWQE